MTEIICQWCQQEIPQIVGYTTVIVTGTIQNRYENSLLENEKLGEVRMYFFCSGSCKDLWKHNTNTRLG